MSITERITTMLTWVLREILILLAYCITGCLSGLGFQSPRGFNHLRQGCLYTILFYKVCKKFNVIGSNLLSRGFMQIEKRHAAIFKRVKSMLPRRESERRIHPLFRHCDILSAVETRISMLNMTYMKYIQNNMCCFIPGKVLDELDRVLNIVEKVDTPPRTHEILQELRDISSMAMEYFDEKILPSIKELTSTSSNAILIHSKAKKVDRSSFLIVPFHPASVSANKGPKVYFVQPGLQEEIRKMAKTNKKQKGQINFLSKIIQKLYNKIEKQNNTIKTQSALLQEHETKLQEQSSKLQEHEVTINDLKKHIDEWDQKFSDLTSEVILAREDVVKAVLFPSLPENKGAGPPTHKTIIRPRLSQVQAPNTYIMELERKRKASIEFDIPNKLRFIVPRESALQLREKLNNKMNENITQNISKNIRINDDTSKKKSEFGSFLSTSLENLFKDPIGSIKSRKRRMTDELDLNLN